AAVEAIASGWKEDPDTLPWLNQGTTDAEWAVRYAAVQAIATGWKEDPDTLPLLKQATTDADEDVRSAAVEAIASGWIHEPGIFELLSQIALTDPFVREENWQENPRQTALEALLKNYPDCPADTLRERPEVVEILRDRSINDSDEPLRQFAQNKLAEWEGVIVDS
ncbi:MAG: HEAT repeat domain-containing protein, partial [Geitlerinemataceae cyanobacterium]